MTDAQSTMTFREHLAELRKRLLRATLAVLVGFFVAWGYRTELFALLSGPVRQALADHGLYAIKALAITESIEVYMKLSLFGGVALASPYVAWQVWAFVAPGLLDKEKRLAWPVIAATVACFLAGAAFCYLVVLPFMTDFLIRLTIEDPVLTLEPTLASTMGFSVMMLLAFGAVFELPLFMYVLAAFGLVTAGGLWRFYRYWVVIAFILGAVLTPTPDPVNQLLMSAPLVVLYGMGVLVAWLAERPAGQPLPRRTLVALALGLVVLAGGGLAWSLRERDPSLEEDVPATAREVLGVRWAALPSLRTGVVAQTELARVLAPFDWVKDFGLAPSGQVALLVRFDDGDALVLEVAEARKALDKLAKSRRSSVVQTPSGPSVWLARGQQAPVRVVATGKRVLWLGGDTALAHLAAVRQGRKPALMADTRVRDGWEALRSSGPMWAVVPSVRATTAWLPSPGQAERVRLASAVLDRDRHLLQLRLDATDLAAAVRLREDLEATSGDSRSTLSPPPDPALRQLTAQVQELAELVAKSVDQVQRAQGVDAPVLAATSVRASQLARELADRAREPVQAVHSPLAAVLQASPNQTVRLEGATVVWQLDAAVPTLLDLLLAPGG
jgi:sec-independent protein translocase protein TatC